MGPKKKTILGLLVFSPLWVIKSAHCIIEGLYWKSPAFLFQIPYSLWKQIRPSQKTKQKIHTAKTKCRKFETNIPKKDYRGLSSNFHIHVSVSELYIPTMGLPILLEEICRLILGIHKLEIRAEAALFPEK